MPSFRLAALASCALALAGCAAEPPAVCVNPVQLEQFGHLLFTHVTINGQDVKALVDTGAVASFVTDALVERIGLPKTQYNGMHAVGVNASEEKVGTTLVLHFAFAGYDHGGAYVQVVTPHFGRATNSHYEAVLGADILSHFDLDLDVSHNTLTAYDRAACGTMAVPAWTGAFDTIPTGLSSGALLSLPVQLNGTPHTAVLDTGATSSTIDLHAAAAAGVTRAMLAGDEKTSAAGVAGRRVGVFAHRFDTLQIGAETFARPLLPVLDVDWKAEDAPERDFEMLIGANYLWHHRLWLSWRDRKLFVQRLGNEGW